MPKFNVGDEVVVTSQHSIFSGQTGHIQSVFSSESSPGLVAYSVFIRGFKRFFHEDILGKVEKTITLQERAREEMDKLRVNSILTVSEKLNLAGWYKGEWTCACCGTMIGKNLKGESPFALARKHSLECEHI
jgi:hypothetical protein